MVSIRILILGSLTIDIIEGKKLKGGPAYFCSLAAELLGVEYFCCGIKPWGYQWDQPNGEFMMAEGPMFEHRYVGSERISNLIAAPRIFKRDIPNLANYDIVFINPVYKEFDYELVKHIASRRRVVIDAQGFLRQTHGRRIVIMKAGKAELELFNKCWVLHISADELSAFDSIPPKPITLITYGAEGSRLIVKEKEYFVPAYRVEGDQTGAGDFFMVIFAVRYTQNDDPLEATLYATAVTSLFVEGVIPRNLKLARTLLSKVEKLIDQRLRALRPKIKEI